MNPKKKAALEAIDAKSATVKTLLAKGATDAGISDEESVQAETLMGEIKTHRAEVAKLDQIDSMSATLEETKTWMTSPANVIAQPGGNVTQGTDAGGDTETEIKAFRVPAECRRSRVTSFKSDAGGYDKHQKAYIMGMVFLSSLDGAPAQTKAVQWLSDHGLYTKVQQESVNTLGGVLVPMILESDLIDLREQYGVFRQYAKNVPMTSESHIIPRRTGGLTAYFTAETADTTESSKNWDSVTLNAKDISCLSYYTRDLSEDTIINIGNDLAQESSYAFAVKEDNCGWNGDGTSTYGGMLGIKNKFQAMVVAAGGTWATDAHKIYAAGITVGTAATWAGTTLADLHSVQSTLPQYAEARGQAAWFCSKAFRDSVIQRLMLAAGGVTSGEIAAGVELRLLGAPIHISQALSQPSTTASSDIPLIYGDLGLASAFGDRRRTTIAMSEHVRFVSGQIAIRASERFDINNHDIGNASTTLGSRVTGPIVALALKA